MLLLFRPPSGPVSSAMSMRVQIFSYLLTVGVAALVASTPSAARAQPDEARVAFRAGRALALAGHPDSALVTFAAVGSMARASGDWAMLTAAARATADVYLVYRSCADSAVRILQDAVTIASPGDRSAADALVRVLAASGDAAGARAVLVKAYADVPSVGRNITRESVTFLQGMAAVERAAKHEDAAATALSSALQIATRMHEGDIQDSATHAVGNVTAENAWVLFDLAQLRLHAKSAGVVSVKEGTRLMDQLSAAWPTVEDPDTVRFPTSRIGDRLLLLARECQKNGTSCPVPKPTKC